MVVDDIVALAEEEQEVEVLVESVDKICTRCKIKVTVEKTKLLTNSTNGIQKVINVKGQKLGTVINFKYLGAGVSDDGANQRSSQGLQSHCNYQSLKPVWRDTTNLLDHR